MTNRAEWIGNIAPVASAIKTGSIDGGARITLDMPESGMDALAAVIGMRGKPLRILIVEDDATFGTGLDDWLGETERSGPDAEPDDYARSTRRHRGDQIPT